MISSVKITKGIRASVRELARLRKSAERVKYEIAREERALAALPRRFGFPTALAFLEAVARATGTDLPRGGRKIRVHVVDLRRLADSGLSAAAIARHLKISPQTVYNRCSREGIRLAGAVK